MPSEAKKQYAAKMKQQLGVAHGTANNKLKKHLIHMLAVKCGMDNCFRCGEKIKVEDLSIEHKEPWLDSDNPADLFFDLDNIAFSHHSCNVAAGRRVRTHGISRYEKGCRCKTCKSAKAEKQRRYRNNIPG